MNINVDYHVHSKYSHCGEMAIEKIAETAAKKGIKKYFVTDHSSHFYFPEQESWEFRYLKDRRIFDRVKAKGRKKVMQCMEEVRKFYAKGARTGMEADFDFDGELLIDYDYRDKLDIVIGAIHWLPCLWDKYTEEKLADEFLEYTLKLLDKDIAILAHPTRVFKWDERDYKVPSEVIGPIIEKAKAKGIALEINSHSKNPDSFFIKKCIEKGATIALCTDSHNQDEFGDFSYHKEILKDCGIAEDEILGKVKIYEKGGIF